MFKKFLKRFTRKKNEIESDDDCLICLDNSNKKIKLKCCGVELHSKCLKKWNKIKRECPHCRAYSDHCGIFDRIKRSITRRLRFSYLFYISGFVLLFIPPIFLIGFGLIMIGFCFDISYLYINVRRITRPE